MKKIMISVLVVSLFACNNEKKDTPTVGDSLNQVNPQTPSTTPSNDTNSYQRMNDHIPDSANH